MYCVNPFRCRAGSGPFVRLAFRLGGALLGLLAPAGQAMAGDGVLYEQDAQFFFGSFEGIQVNTFLHAEDAAYSSQGADDFTISDPAGWSVTQISFLAGGTPANPTAANVWIYPDNGGSPAAAPICSAPDSPLTDDLSIDPPFLKVTFATACSLPQGTYWIVLSFPSAARDTQRSYWSPMSQDETPHGAAALWRNPGDALGNDCQIWGTLQKCGLTHSYWTNPDAAEFVFRIYGHAGRQAGAVNLAMTASLLDPLHPDACGAQNTLDVTPGDAVNLCYRVSNASGIDLPLQNLTDSVDGTVLTLAPLEIDVGQTYQYNRIVTVGSETQHVASWTALDSRPGYDHFDGVADFVELTESPTASYLDVPFTHEDDYTTAVFLPGSIPFFGQSRDVICVGNNGYILLANSNVNISCPLSGLWRPEALPSPQFPYPAIIPSWVDLFTDGYLLYDRQGDSPESSKYYLEWYRKNRYTQGTPAPGNLRFEVMIDAATGAITFQYASMAFADSESPLGDYGQGAAVGLQQDSTTAVQYSFGQPVLTDGKAINWLPHAPATFNATASVQFNPGAPVIGTTPTALIDTATAGTLTTDVLAVDNSGNRNLTWTIDQVPANRHFPVLPAPFVAPLGDPLATRLTRTPQRTSKPGELTTGRAGTHVTELPTPAYAVSYNINTTELSYVSFDASAPTSYTVIAPGPNDPAPNPGGGFHVVNYSASTFVDNDFAKEYLLDQNGAFGTIDTATGAFTLINPLILPESCFIGSPCWTGLKWDDTTGTLFAISTRVPSDEAGSESLLYSIDRATGDVTQIGPPMPNTVIFSLAIDPQGLLYGLDAGNDQLIAIDKETGAFQFIGSIGFDVNFDQDMDFDPSTGILWYAGVDAGGSIAMYTINPASGLATYYSPIFDNNEIFAMSIAEPWGPCGRPADSPWLTYDVTAGTTAPGTSSPITVTLDASALEPGTYRATLCIPSNDPLRHNHPLPVPVKFDVTASSNTIFVDGFESSL
jgi:hypothetical protein